MRKKQIGIILLLGLVLLSGCQSQKAFEEAPKGSNPISEQEPPGEARIPVQTPDRLETAEAVLHGKVIEAENGHLLVINHGEDARASQLYTLTDAQELKAGDLIDIYYNGLVMETYPGMLGEVYGIKKTGEEEDFVALYLDIFQELYEIDEGLNDGIEEIAFDLEKASNLTELEKEALLYKIWCLYQKETFLSTYEELKEEGRLDEEGFYYEKGLLVTIAVEAEGENCFEYSANKWRSGLGAIGYSDGVAKKEAGKWTYQPGAFWIS